MARRNKHSLEEIREMVLDAAESIIINDGYSALTVRKIALDIGYTVGSVYMVFANMADLLMHIKANTVAELNGQLQQVQGYSAEQQLTELAKAYLQFAVQNFNRWTLIYMPDAEMPAGYRQKIDGILKLVETPLAQLAPERSAQQCKLAARALWSGIHGICSLSLSGKAEAEAINDVENTIALLVDSFIGGWVNALPSKK